MTDKIIKAIEDQISYLEKQRLHIQIKLDQLTEMLEVIEEIKDKNEYES